MAAVDLLLAGRLRKPGIGGIHGGERWLVTLGSLAMGARVWISEELPAKVSALWVF